MTRSEMNVRGQILRIVAIADGPAPEESASKRRYEAAQRVTTEYRRVLDLPFFKRFSQMQKLQMMTDEFWEEFPQS